MQVTNIVNGVDVDRLVGTIEHISADADAGAVSVPGSQPVDRRRPQPHDDQGFYGAGQRGHEPHRAVRRRRRTSRPSCSAKNQAPNAPEYLLHALAACLTGTIVYHAAARGIALDGLECTIEGDVDLHGFLGLDETVRPGYEQIRVAFEATGDFDDDAARRARPPHALLARPGHRQQPRPRRDRRGPRLKRCTTTSAPAVRPARTSRFPESRTRRLPPGPALAIAPARTAPIA